LQLSSPLFCHSHLLISPSLLITSSSSLPLLLFSSSSSPLFSSSLAPTLDRALYALSYFIRTGTPVILPPSSDYQRLLGVYPYYLESSTPSALVRSLSEVFSIENQDRYFYYYASRKLCSLISSFSLDTAFSRWVAPVLRAEPAKIAPPHGVLFTGHDFSRITEVLFSFFFFFFLLSLLLSLFLLLFFLLQFLFPLLLFFLLFLFFFIPVLISYSLLRLWTTSSPSPKHMKFEWTSGLVWKNTTRDVLKYSPLGHLSFGQRVVMVTLSIGQNWFVPTFQTLKSSSFVICGWNLTKRFVSKVLSSSSSSCSCSCSCSSFF
jgi:hypothetical protein